MPIVFIDIMLVQILPKQKPALSLQVMEVDINGDGTIDFQEFLGMMKSKANEADQESDLREAFKIFDRDKDGYIDMKELKKVVIIGWGCEHLWRLPAC